MPERSSARVFASSSRPERSSLRRTLAPDATIQSEIVEHLVTALYELIDGELVAFYLDALRWLGLAPSPTGWGNDDSSCRLTLHGRARDRSLVTLEPALS